MYTQAKVYIRNSDAFASAGPGTPHGAQMIQPLLDIIRLHQPVGSCEHAVSPMRPEPLFNDMEDLAPKALAEWSFFWNFLGIYFGRRFAQRLGLKVDPLREGCWRRCRAGGTSVDTRATSVRSSHVCSRARLEHRIACVDAGYLGRMRERLVGPDRRLTFQWGGGLVRVWPSLLRAYAQHGGCVSTQ